MILLGCVFFSNIRAIILKMGKYFNFNLKILLDINLFHFCRLDVGWPPPLDSGGLMGYDYGHDHGKGVGGDPEPGTQKREISIYIYIYKNKIYLHN